MHKAILVLAAVGFAVLGTAVPAQAGVITEHCKFDHQAPDDPIVFPGQPGATHLHNFSGAPGVDAYSTPGGLLAAVRTACDDTGDFSGYWTPVIYVDGVAQKANQSPYWLVKPGQPVVAAPFGLELVTPRIWGVNAAWACTAGSNNFASVPNCTGKGYVKLRVLFPSCWDGSGTTNADVVYPTGSNIITNKLGTSCPAGTVRIPGLLLQVDTKIVDGTARVWTLSSGDMTTMHADWMNAFSDSSMSNLVARLNAKA